MCTLTITLHTHTQFRYSYRQWHQPKIHRYISKSYEIRPNSFRSYLQGLKMTFISNALTAWRSTVAKAYAHLFSSYARPRISFFRRLECTNVFMINFRPIEIFLTSTVCHILFSEVQQFKATWRNLRIFVLGRKNSNLINMKTMILEIFNTVSQLGEYFFIALYLFFSFYLTHIFKYARASYHEVTIFLHCFKWEKFFFQWRVLNIYEYF